MYLESAHLAFLTTIVVLVVDAIISFRRLVLFIWYILWVSNYLLLQFIACFKDEEDDLTEESEDEEINFGGNSDNNDDDVFGYNANFNMKEAAISREGEDFCSNGFEYHSLGKCLNSAFLKSNVFLDQRSSRNIVNKNSV